ncbi:MAG: DNA recombination protein RmuC [Weeksellaceae bacterium]
MDIPTVILIIVSTVVILVVLRLWLSNLEKKSGTSDELIAWIKDMGERMEKSTNQVDQRLTVNMDQFNKRLDNAAQAMMGVQKSIGEFSEIGRSMKQLQDLLQSPKLRGQLGEQILNELLIQFLPQDSFALQHAFQSGEKVDAIIKTSQGFIPIDAKFPMSNFRHMVEAVDEAGRAVARREFEKDVKNHLKSISKKYILVGEGTIDYALMYIPAESVYYEIINSPTLCDFAEEVRVIPVSPMSFYAYLKVILLSFEGQRIEKQAHEIIAILQSMKKDYEKADESIALLHKHLGNAYNQSTQVIKNVNTLGQKIHSTSQLTTQVEKQVEQRVEQEKLIE